MGLQVNRLGQEIQFKIDTAKIERILGIQKELGDAFPKIGIFVISYNASAHIQKTVSRIPPRFFCPSFY